jgi:hypothetical protein
MKLIKAYEKVQITWHPMKGKAADNKARLITDSRLLIIDQNVELLIID